jgi:hypothetical protein
MFGRFHFKEDLVWTQQLRQLHKNESFAAIFAARAIGYRSGLEMASGFPQTPRGRLALRAGSKGLDAGLTMRKTPQACCLYRL